MDIDHVIRQLVEDALPEFELPGVPTEEPSGYSEDGRAYFLEFSRERTDGMFEKIVFQKDFFENEWLISFQMVTHFFPECPIPAFPFGIDAGLENLIQESGITAAVDSWYSCGNELERAQERLKPLRSAIIEFARPTFETWAEHLHADPVLNCAIRHYQEWPEGRTDIRDFLIAEIQRIADSAQAWRTSKAVPKIVSQMIVRHSGDERWQRC